MVRLFKIDDNDNIALSFNDLDKGEKVCISNTVYFILMDAVPAGHKVALCDIPKGGQIIKYGAAIGFAIVDIKKGDHVHTHNVKTGLTDNIEYEYKPNFAEVQSDTAEDIELKIYRRANGKVGIRNEIWVIPTVGCVNGVADNIVKAFQESGDYSGVDGVYCFKHPYGCSQLGNDHERTRKTLQNIALNSNAGGVLILGLGCENNQIETFRETMPEEFDPERILFMEAQAFDDEVAVGVELLKNIYDKVSRDEREKSSWNDIVIGLECGGSDALSGITANPLIGKVSDYIVSRGGTTVLTEVPEMFGAEHILMEQCINHEVFTKTVNMINDYKKYYSTHDQPIYENPSPGNKSGGITTLEDKSLGCIRKAGKSKIVDVIKIDQRLAKSGFNLLYSPGNDIVATTSLGACGCQLVLFSTGRGTPLGGFIPIVKIASNSALASKKTKWIDFDAGVLADPNTDVDKVFFDFLRKVATIINGEQTSAERRNDREIAIFKSGVTL